MSTSRSRRARLRIALPSVSLPALALAAALAGCGNQETSPPEQGDRPTTPAAAPGTPEALLDQAAEWWGGREALAAEKGFSIEGTVTVLPAGGGDAIELSVEVIARHQPYSYRERQFVSREDSLTGEVMATNEIIKIVNGTRAWSTDLTTGKISPDIALATNIGKQPTPRKILLFREHHLTLEDRGEEPIGELGGMQAHRLLATAPDGSFVWVYVDLQGRLRKLSFQDSSRGVWIAVVFESYRDPEQLGGMAVTESVAYYRGNELVSRFTWGKRDPAPELTEEIFLPPQ